MHMEIYTLPEYLDVASKGSVQLFNYQTTRETWNNRINLTKNTFSFLLEGTKEVTTGTNSIRIENSHFLLMNSGHCLMTEILSNERKDYHSVLLFFTDDDLLELMNKHKQVFSDVTKTSHTAQAKMVHVFNYDVFLKAFVKSLQQILTLKPNLQERMLPSKLEELFLYLVDEFGQDFLQFLRPKDSSGGMRFKQFVEVNKLTRLSLAELAFLSNRSVSTFKREFEKQYGESPIKWFQLQRLNHAAFLIKKKNKRPSEIFEELGYQDLASFSHAFKNHFGLSPKQYEKD